MSASSRMSVLMDDLLTLSRVNRKGKPFETVDVNKALQTVLEDLQITIRKANAESPSRWKRFMPMRARCGNYYRT